MSELNRDIAVADELLALAPKIIEQLHEGIVIVDDSLNVIFINSSAELMFDYHRTQVIGKNVNILLPDALRERHNEHTAKYLTSPSPRPMGAGLKLQGQTRKGRQFPVEIGLTPFMTPLGTFVVAVIHAVQ